MTQDTHTAEAQYAATLNMAALDLLKLSDGVSRWNV